jgi:hypothetical protein
LVTISAFWLLIGRINEVFLAAQKARMWRMSLLDPRGRWAVDNHDRDPFAGAVWNIDQVLKPDHLPDPWPAMYLNDAEWCCQEAEQYVINHKRSERLRETPHYKEVHARICHLTDIEVEICRSMWNEGGVRVRDCQFDSELYGRFRHEAIFHNERRAAAQQRERQYMADYYARTTWEQEERENREARERFAASQRKNST